MKLETNSSALRGLLLSLGAAYGLALIYAGSSLVNGERYFLLFDDAMISMRYARNLAEGFGLAFNPGEGRVEGFTNLLWTLWMALLHKAPLSERLLQLWVQLSGLGFLLAAVWLLSGWKSGPETGKAGFYAAVATLACYPLLYWSSFGMEVGALCFCYVLCFVSLNSAEGARLKTAWIASVVALCLRQDAAAFLAPLWAFHTLGQAREKHLGLGLAFGALLLLGLGAPTIWRHFYFGDWLPNTYHLKLAGIPLSLRLPRGAHVMGLFLFTALPFVLAALWTAWRHQSEAWVTAALGAFIGVAAYSVWVGGDAWEAWGGPNRFLAPAMPLLFLLALRAIQGRQLAWLALAGACLWSNATRNSHGLAEWSLAKAPLYADDNATMASAGIKFRQGDPKIRLGLSSLGHISYYSRRPCEDLLGKTDRVIAHGPVHPSVLVAGWKNYVPGHAKWDYGRSCELPTPLFILQPIHLDREAEKVLLACGFEKAPPYAYFKK